MSTDITLKLDGEALREATMQAMIGVLSPDAKSKMIERSITLLLKPSTNSWENKKSPIELAFDQAVIQLATEEAKKAINEDQSLRERIAQLLRLTADKVLNTDMDAMAQRMADAFVEAMRKT